MSFRFPILISFVYMLMMLRAQPVWADETVYESVQSDGVPVFASERRDESYHLVISERSTRPSFEGRRPVSIEAQQSVARSCLTFRVPCPLAHAVASIESNFDPTAISPKGAVGVMQVMPKTAAQIGGDDRGGIDQNVDAGMKMLAKMIARFDGNLPLALAAYNAGPDAVSHAGNRIPPIPETMLYVASVLARMRGYETIGTAVPARRR